MLELVEEFDIEFKRFSPGPTRWVLGIDENSYGVEDVSSGNCVNIRVDHYGKTQWARSQDGRFVLAGVMDEGIRMFDALSGEELRRFKGPQYFTERFELSSDGRYFISLGYEASKLSLWDTIAGCVVSEIEGHNKIIRAFAVSSDWRHLVSGSEDHTAILWDLMSGKELRRFFGHEDIVSALTFSQDGRFIYSGSADLTARKWDCQSGVEHCRYGRELS